MTGSAIFALFGSKTAITDIIGAGDNMRLYPGVLPQGVALPAMTYRLLPNQPTNDGSGSSRFDFRSVDFHAFDYTQDGAEELIATVRGEIEDQRGTYAGVEINHVLYMNDQNNFSESLERFVHQIEFQFNYRR